MKREGKKGLLVVWFPAVSGVLEVFWVAAAACLDLGFDGVGSFPDWRAEAGLLEKMEREGDLVARWLFFGGSSGDLRVREEERTREEMEKPDYGSEGESEMRESEERRMPEKMVRGEVHRRLCGTEEGETERSVVRRYG
ncbi:hypothetical protein HAX54_033537 [Datura stramonium]|uniref:Uncharacterized protein n=1 Tax=Datura stramonium TaxID=4076 RepID=A0ABS8RLU5_DATST|nr:hypothetical protein [Datura stramonium]